MLFLPAKLWHLGCEHNLCKVSIKCVILQLIGEFYAY